MVSKKQQLLTILFLQLTVQEPHNRIASTPEEGGLKEEINADNNITIIDSTSRNILRPQLKNMTY